MGAPDNDVTPHPSDLELAAYLDGRVDPPTRERIEAHLAECPECRDDIVATRSLRPRRRFDSRRAVGALAASAAVLLLAVTLVWRGGSHVGSEQATRSSAPPGSPIPTYQPAAVARERPVRFIWATVPGALSYRLTITSSDGAPVWTRSATDTSAFMPDSLASAGGRLFLWSVDALLSDGTERSSGLRELELAP